jgi:2-haloacid dehalogenase
MIDTVVFDLGGVLVHWNPRYLYRKLFDDEHAMERFLADICTAEWNEQQDAGRPFHEATALLRAKHPQHAELIDAFWLRWEETLGGANEATVAVLAELKARGTRLYALTNWSHETFPIAQRLYRFLDQFEGIVVSGSEKLVKPDPEIYRRLLQRYDIDPARALYIDDAPKNVTAAADLGMHAWHFRDADGLRNHLVSLGLLDDDAKNETTAHG